jgi:hypothetical protein
MDSAHDWVSAEPFRSGELAAIAKSPDELRSTTRVDYTRTANQMSPTPDVSAAAFDGGASAVPERAEYRWQVTASRWQPKQPTRSVRAIPTARCRESGARDDGSDARTAADLAEGDGCEKDVHPIERMEETEASAAASSHGHQSVTRLGLDRTPMREERPEAW